MDQAKLFLSSFGGKADPSDPGDPIYQSLRFRGAQKLERIISSTTINDWTYSFWFKASGRLVSGTFNGFVYEANGWLGLYPNSGSNAGKFYAFFNSTGENLNLTTPSVYRDYSAWYHVVYSNNGLYINGEFVPNSTPTQAKITDRFILGEVSGSHDLDGYMADVYFIDGQALEPTVFGRFNANDVWVPVRPEGLTFGSNGFHLDFSDPNDIGADRSPNGNDFTATGFNTDPVGIFSNDLTSSTGSFLSSNPPSNAFDGNGNTYAYSDNGATISFAPTTPITVNEVCMIYSNIAVGGSLTWQGVTTQRTETGWTVFTNSDGSNQTGVIDENNPLTFTGPADSASGFVGIFVDDGYLVDNTGTNYDLMEDSPTNNFATGNPLMITPSGGNSSRARLENANLTFYGPSSQGQIGSTFYLPDSEGQYYWEFIDQSTQASYPAFGVRRDRFNTVDCGAYTCGKPYFLLIYQSGRVISTQQNAANSLDFTDSNLTHTNGDVIGAAYDGTRNKIWFSKNGVFSPLSGSPAAAGTDRDGFDLEVADDWTPNQMVSQGHRASINYGQQPFLYAPPAGFSALQTQNLPEAPILNGRDHFQAITLENYIPPSGDRIISATQVSGKNYTATHSTSSTTFTTAQQINDALNKGCIFSSPTTGSYRLEFDPPVSIDSISDNGDTASPTGALKINGTDLKSSLGCSTRYSNISLSSFEVAHQQQSWIVLVGINNSTPIAFEEVVEVELASGSDMSDYSVGDIVTTLENPYIDRGVIQGVNVSSRILTIGVTNGNFVVSENIFVFEEEILYAAQTVFPNGLWWIKDRVNSNNHQLVDSVRGGNIAVTSPGEAVPSAYVPPAGNSVAWCWNAGGAAVTNDDGSLESQVSANTDAGFSIVTYTGNGANAPATIGHGLTEAPEFMILAFTNTTGQRSVYHQSIGNTARLRLNSNVGVDTSQSHWNNTSPTDTVFTVGENFNQGTAWNYVTYCWHSVPGYSSFGKHTGGGGDNGPFIYTGFRPAFILLKSTTLANGWVLMDSTISPSNPSTSWFIANETTGEQNAASPTIDIDFLSNGFKIRNSDNAINQAGADYVYACFAENPFQSPVTAR